MSILHLVSYTLSTSGRTGPRDKGEPRVEDVEEERVRSSRCDREK